MTTPASGSRGQHIKSGWKLQHAALGHKQDMVFFVVVGVVDQQVEHHVPKQIAHLLAVLPPGGAATGPTPGSPWI
jgi:hypothetical protein